MRRLKRINNIVEEITTAEHNRDEYLPRSQASFNSDGVITIRNYDNSNKSKHSSIPCESRICIDENKEFWKQKIQNLVKEMEGESK